jgi:hypothetical protein
MNREEAYSATAQQRRLENQAAVLQVAGTLGVTLDVAAKLIATRGNRPYQHRESEIGTKIEARLGEEVLSMHEIDPERLDGESKKGRRYFDVETGSGWYLIGVRENGSKVLSVRRDSW